MDQTGMYIIITCYNEGSGIIRLLRETGELIRHAAEEITVVVVDDGSTDETPRLLKDFNFPDPRLRLRILRLEYNTGHQAAIEQGILFAKSCAAKHVIVMDGDGEDDPSAIPELLKLRSFDIVHVRRGKREESAGFRLAYAVYLRLFYFITGKQMNFGNYCMISDKVIRIISERSFIHLAAFLSRLKLNSTTITFDRRPRNYGNSKMSLAGLVHHAFRSFIEYAEEFLMVFLRLAILLFVLFLLMIVYIVYLKLFTDKAILGWASTLGIGLLTPALVCLGFFTTGILLLNQSHHRTKQETPLLFTVIR
jgi:glycosyltransferase involved in cell wall biosynthesis